MQMKLIYINIASTVQDTWWKVLSEGILQTNQNVLRNILYVK